MGSIRKTRGKGGGVGSNQYAVKGTSRAEIVTQDAHFDETSWDEPGVDDDQTDGDGWLYTPPVEQPPTEEEVRQKLSAHRDQQDELHARMLGYGHGGLVREFREVLGAGWEPQYEDWGRLQQGRSQLRAKWPDLAHRFPALVGLVDFAVAFNEGAPGELLRWAGENEIPGGVVVAAHRAGVTADQIKEAKRAGVDPARYLNLRSIGMGHWRATRTAKRTGAAASPDAGMKANTPDTAPTPAPAPAAAVPGRRAPRRLIRRGIRSTLRGGWRFTKWLAEPFLTPTPPQRRRR